MNDYITPTSPTISTVQLRNLLDMTRSIGCVLTPEEYAEIATVFGKAANRVLKEGGFNE